MWVGVAIVRKQFFGGLHGISDELAASVFVRLKYIAVNMVDVRIGVTEGE